MLISPGQNMNVNKFLVVHLSILGEVLLTAWTWADVLEPIGLDYFIALIKKNAYNMHSHKSLSAFLQNVCD